MLERSSHAAGKQLLERLAIYPAFARRADTWVDPALGTTLLHRIAADGWPRSDEWSPGALIALRAHPAPPTNRPAIAREIATILAKAQTATPLADAEIVRLF